MRYPRFRKIRKERRLTQQEVADVLGVSRKTYAAYEAGKREWTADKVYALSVYYGVTTDYLLGRVGEPSDREKTGVQ